MSLAAMQAEASGGSADTFSRQLEELATRFHVPGLAVEVVCGVDPEHESVLFQKYLGSGDPEAGQAVTAATLFPLASLTKVYSAALLARLAEQGKLSLTDPVIRWLPDSGVAESVQLRHLLSHTSQGNPGEHFYYSGRFGALTSVAQKAGGKPFAELLAALVLQPLALSDTYLYRPEALPGEAIARLAVPHGFDGSAAPMDQEYGVSASAGLVATPRAVIRMGQALMRGALLSEQSYRQLTRPFAPGLPYGMGMFVQEVGGHEVLWAYGQYDGFAGLWIMIPARELQMVALANNNLLSDAARLINGDVTTSPLTLAFLENFLSRAGESDPSATQRARSDLMTSAFLARFDRDEFDRALGALAKLLPTAARWEEQGDLNVLHAVMFLKTVAFHQERPPLDRFDAELEALGKRLLADQPDNPYARYYLAELYAGRGDPASAAVQFRAIVDAENFSPHWYTREAESWLAANPDP
ncbi:MAG: serine hydrolase domain-containing protein [Pseudomonadota bacterium]